MEQASPPPAADYYSFSGILNNITTEYLPKSVNRFHYKVGFLG